MAPLLDVPSRCLLLAKDAERPWPPTSGAFVAMASTRADMSGRNRGLCGGKGGTRGSNPCACDEFARWGECVSPVDAVRDYNNGAAGHAQHPRGESDGREDIAEN